MIIASSGKFISNLDSFELQIGQELSDAASPTTLQKHPEKLLQAKERLKEYREFLAALKGARNGTKALEDVRGRNGQVISRYRLLTYFAWHAYYRIEGEEFGMEIFAIRGSHSKHKIIKTELMPMEGCFIEALEAFRQQQREDT